MTATKPQTPMAVVIAEYRDGTAAYISRSRRSFTTTRRNWAWVMTVEQAEETAGRLNGVAALGQCHRTVAYFRTGPVSR